jgi:hypothetical protein
MRKCKRRKEGVDMNGGKVAASAQVRGVPAIEL